MLFDNSSINKVCFFTSSLNESTNLGLITATFQSSAHKILFKLNGILFNVNRIL